MSLLENKPRRILFVLENAGAGSGRHIIDLSRALLERGHDVTLLYSRTRLESWFEKELIGLDALTTVATDMRPGLHVGDLGSIFAIRRFLSVHGPFDIIHGHSSKGGALGRLAASPRDGVRVYTPHALYTLGFKRGSARRFFFGFLERALARRCEGIICVSEAEHRHALQSGLPADKLFKVPNGLPPLPPVDRAAMRKHIGLEDDEVAIGFVGRLSRQKAAYRLINAFSAVRRQHRHARLVIVGDGPDEIALVDLAAKTGFADAIIWTGAADGRQLMGAFDVFVLCSLYEALPYVLLEAMARGLPIVSTQVGGVDELVCDGENGLVVDETTIAQALSDLIENPQMRRAMGEKSKNLVKKYDVDTMVENTLDVYSTLLCRNTNC